MAGFLLHESDEIIVVVTLGSLNSKTGNMDQVWILNRNINPLSAVTNGADEVICGDCRHRGHKRHGRSCYVNVANAPESVWLAYTRGRYPVMNDYRFFTGRSVRLGAFGDPAFMPLEIIQGIKRYAKAVTGYTHQWKHRPELKSFVMASVDSPEEQTLAASLGWRTFRVSVDTESLKGEIMCPAAEEAGKRTTCERCRLCDGQRNDGRKNIFIKAHGRLTSAFVSIQTVGV